jgi:hypothetical protein
MGESHVIDGFRLYGKPHTNTGGGEGGEERRERIVRVVLALLYGESHVTDGLYGTPPYCTKTREEQESRRPGREKCPY